MRKGRLIIIILLVASLLAISFRSLYAEDKEPKLEFEQVGNELVVSLKVKVNNSPHLLQTSYSKKEGQVLLKYVVIQNYDLFRRSLKEIVVQWRLKDHKKGGPSYEVERFIANFKTDELQRVIEDPYKKE